MLVFRVMDRFLSHEWMNPIDALITPYTFSQKADTHTTNLVLFWRQLNLLLWKGLLPRKSIFIHNVSDVMYIEEFPNASRKKANMS